jgi:hypothetical protein
LYVVSRNIKTDEGHCDAVIKSAQMAIGRLEKFEAQADELSDTADPSDAAHAGIHMRNVPCSTAEPRSQI